MANVNAGHPQKILLTGINGQLGHVLQASLAKHGRVVSLDRSQLDLADAGAIQRVVRQIKPDLIINPAAYTAVDRAESEPELALAINAHAPRTLAEEAARCGAAMIHYSTDYVYDGSKPGAYSEDDASAPLSVYGKTKLAGEQAIQHVGLPHLILRTSWVYGAYGRNFLHTILRLAAEREQLRVVADQIGAPTSSRSLAQATSAIIDQWRRDVSGIYHLTNAGATSWHGFAQAILTEYASRQAAQSWPSLKASAADVIAITTADYPTPAPRPANSVLSCSKIHRQFALDILDWRSALVQVFDELTLAAG